MTPPGATLITGGAGYIGAHVMHALRDSGDACCVVDDLSTGQSSFVPSDVPFLCADIADTSQVGAFLAENRVDTVVHCAGKIVVPDSVSAPLYYYDQNVAKTVTFLQTAVSAGVRHVVFSSSAAVYGQPEIIPVDESVHPRPLTPYGHSKLMVEQILSDAATAYDISVASLRYFNVAGADAAGRCGQIGGRSTHLVRVACETALGHRDAIEVYGTDYPTPDGTCIRDYIHVSDLAEAHRLAVMDLRAGGSSFVANCGYGHGFSVRQIIEAVQHASAAPFAVRDADRRPGDPAEIVSDPTALKNRLGWEPARDDLESIVASALRWEAEGKAHHETRTEASS